MLGGDTGVGCQDVRTFIAATDVRQADRRVAAPDCVLRALVRIGLPLDGEIFRLRNGRKNFWYGFGRLFVYGETPYK